ncbi:MAG: hypothetical protein VYE73_03830 [Acidobacteriota bacterium]|nr:hypothetical protein [Acidobacteriota bacterium]
MLRSTLLAVVLSSSLVPTASAEVQPELDLRQAEAVGEVVWLLVGPDQRSFGLAATAHGQAMVAFGMWPGDEGDRVGPVSGDLVASMRQDGSSLALLVDAPIAAEARELLATWNRREYEHPPAHELLDLSERLVRVVHGLKRPYRSALAPPDAPGYFSDLLTLNRPSN